MEEKSDIAKLTENWRKDYESRITYSHNEWLVEDLEGEIDELNKMLFVNMKRGLISREEYQSYMAVAWEQVTKLRIAIDEFEDEEDYIRRLTGQT